MENNIVNSTVIETAMDEKTSKIVSDLQVALIDILAEIIRVCDKHDLKYALVAGTLLGAIRHKGFIPWDDDLDIIMPRDDYEKFREIAPKELKEKYFFQDYSTDSAFPSIYAKVRNSETTLIENGYRNIKGMNHGVFLDVFPADRYKASSKNNLRRKIIKFCNNILLFQKVSNVNKAVNLASRLFPRKPLFKLAEKISIQMDSEKGNNQYIIINEYVMPDGIFDELIDVPFETISAKVPKNYDVLLSDMFGDYMKLPPVDKRAPKHITEMLSLTVPYRTYMEQNMNK